MTPTILIADDDPEMIDLYQTYLGLCGYRVLTASGGMQCLPIIRQESPAVIVASVEIPWGGADGLLDYLQQESSTGDVPAVILTGDTADEEVTPLRESPCVFRYLRKPFLMGRLLDYVRAIEFDLRDAGRPNVSCRRRQSIAACN